MPTSSEEKMECSDAAPLRIAMVCDFFYPRLGGVENHIYALAQHLTKLGHYCIIITNAYEPNRCGVRYLSSPSSSASTVPIIKVYYCPIRPMVDQVAAPTFTATLPLLRHIFIRESIQIVHAHQATSTLGNEAIVYASALGLRSVYTDHSLFGFHDVASVILNRVLQTTLSTVNACICVSHVCRDNLTLRAQIKSPTRVHVIPNAVDSTKFKPITRVDNNNKSNHTNNRITIVVVSRLVYRKGVDLLMGIIPEICSSLPNVDFLIAGDGNRKCQLEEIVMEHNIDKTRVQFLGGVSHDQVCRVLNRGQVFLNCSLTESFCMAILEAASVGLLVVAAKVGGVPEVLPDDMVILAEPNVMDMVEALKTAVKRQSNPETRSNPMDQHKRIKSMYSWSRVADETTVVYRDILAKNNNNDDYLLWNRLCRYYSSLGGGISSLVVCLLVVILEIWLIIVKWWQPRESIDVMHIMQ